VKDNINGIAVLFLFFPSFSEAHLKGGMQQREERLKGNK
jgi:hypothetical protein